MVASLKKLALPFKKKDEEKRRWGDGERKSGSGGHGDAEIGEDDRDAIKETRGIHCAKGIERSEEIKG